MRKHSEVTVLVDTLMLTRVFKAIPMAVIYSIVSIITNLKQNYDENENGIQRCVYSLETNRQ